jgi:hypothetical protein
VALGVGVKVAVGDGVGVLVSVEVGLGVAVDVRVAVTVAVGVEVAVSVAVGAVVGLGLSVSVVVTAAGAGGGPQLESRRQAARRGGALQGLTRMRDLLEARRDSKPAPRRSLGTEYWPTTERQPSRSRSSECQLPGGA